MRNNPGQNNQNNRNFIRIPLFSQNMVIQNIRPIIRGQFLNINFGNLGQFINTQNQNGHIEIVPIPQQFGQEVPPPDEFFTSSSVPIKLKFQLDQGINFFRDKNFLKAFKCFEVAFKEEPLGVFQANMALCYKKNNLWKQSLKHINIAISLSPNNHKYLRLAGHLYFDYFRNFEDIKNGLKALEAFARAFEIEPSQKNKENYLEIRKSLYIFKSIQNKKDRNELENYLSAKEEILNGDSKTKEGLERLKRSKILTQENVSKFLKEQYHNSNQTVHNFYLDVIGLETLKEPLVTPSGNSFEKSTLMEHCKTSGHIDPVSRKKFKDTTILASNKNLEEAILNFHLKHPWIFRKDFNDNEFEDSWKFAYFH